MIFEKQQIVANCGFFTVLDHFAQDFSILGHEILLSWTQRSNMQSYVFSKLLKGRGFKSCCDHLVLCSCDPIKTWSNDSDELIRRPNYNFSLTYTPDIVARIHDHNYSLTYHVKQLLLITYPVLVQNKNLKPLVTCFVSVAQR